MYEPNDELSFSYQTPAFLLDADVEYLGQSDVDILDLLVKASCRCTVMEDSDEAR